jgi:uncharacterized protein YsxB (DUF464 family)
MTTYKVKKDNEEAVLEVKGHSGFAKYGEDIVCASISTACIMSANLIDNLNLGYNILDLNVSDGYFKIKLKIVDETVNGIFDNLIETLNELSNQYPKHLKIKN